MLTSLSDDSVGAGFTPSGALSSNTNNSNNPTTGTAGAWRGFLFDEFSNDRNVAIVRESENPLTNGNDVNSNTVVAQNLGVIAPDQKSGDENRRLGYAVKGYISPTNPDDVDVYSFNGTAGTEVWIDIDRTDTNLDAIVEVINSTGTVLARSVRSGGTDPGNLNAPTLTKNPLFGGDHYTQNFRDPGFRYVLPGTAGQTGTYFVRVSAAIRIHSATSRNCVVKVAASTNCKSACVRFKSIPDRRFSLPTSVMPKPGSMFAACRLIAR